MKNHFVRCIFVVTALGLLTARVAHAEDAPAPAQPVIKIQGDDWDSSREDIEKVLASAASQLMPHFPGRKLQPILVSRREGVPITLNQKGPAGEYQVRLGVTGTYWAQYTYQFSHELCHILSNYDHHDGGKSQWFEEALCETSSLFVLSRMHEAWETNPPYPNWKTWGVHFDEYLNEMLAKRSRRLPPDQTMPQWLAANLAAMVKEDALTDRSKLAAAYLLPIFQDDPDGWESLNWLNMGEHDDDLDFAAYLRAWRERVPEKHKAFVGKIQTLFGCSTK